MYKFVMIIAEKALIKALFSIIHLSILNAIFFKLYDCQTIYQLYILSPSLLIILVIRLMFA